MRRERIKKVWDKVTLGGGYVGGAGGLGTITKLLHFKYKNMSPEQQRLLDSKLLHKYVYICMSSHDWHAVVSNLYRRPYFTYWLMTVHVIIMIVALALYGFAPYGWDLIEERASVRQTDLSFAATSRLVVPSVWFGPPQQSLVLLGALFAPCMRRDGQIFEAIESDRETERDMSGCCVRRDRSGCFQATTCQVHK